MGDKEEGRAPLAVIPAIDILGGRCVRLRQGSYDDVKAYTADPVDMARRFAEAGARRIHVVDLDGADGRPETNREVIAKIRREAAATLEVGGGIRSEEVVEGLLEIGVDRLIVGTLLAKEPERVGAWVRRYGARFVAGIDAREGLVQIAGWRQGTELPALELAERAKELGLLSVVYTDISQDGMLSGPNTRETSALAEQAGIPVIVSGGISSMEDLVAIETSADPLVVGAIAGKAIYEGRLDLPKLFKRFPGPTEEVAW